MCNLAKNSMNGERIGLHLKINFSFFPFLFFFKKRADQTILATLNKFGCSWLD